MKKKGSAERNSHGVVGYETGDRVRCNICEKIFESMRSLYLHLAGTDHDDSDWKTFLETRNADVSDQTIIPTTFEWFGWVTRKKSRSLPVRSDRLRLSADGVDSREAVKRELGADSGVRKMLRLQARDEDVDLPEAAKRARHAGGSDMKDWTKIFPQDYAVALEAAEALLLLSKSEPKKVENEQVKGVILFGVDLKEEVDTD